MKLTELNIENFRNIASGHLMTGSGTNFIVGDNGSGKSSVLEALYVLGRGRSFRTPQLAQTIRHDSASFTLRGRFLSDTQYTHHLGLKKVRGTRGAEGRLDGGDPPTREQLHRLFPLLLINSDSYRLIEGGPKYRRQFLDWGVFHVKQSGREAWRDYHRVLKQRNAALRGPRRELDLWSEELATRGECLDGARTELLALLNPLVNQYSELLLGEPGRIEYRVAWEGRDGLLARFMDGVERDRRQGFTKTGPHGANVVVSAGGSNTRERLSRGQEKLMVFSMMLALLELLKQHNGLTSMLMVDDLAAELDGSNQVKVFGALQRIETQLFISGTVLPQGSTVAAGASKVFHVKHGTLSEQ